MDLNLAAERAYNTILNNSTLLPLLLLSLARQKHTPDPANNIKKKYDYIVVGAGAAGSVVAARLSEIPCVSVLLLEAGPPPPRLTDVMALYGNFFFTDIDWQHKTSPQKHTGRGLINRQVTWPAGKTVGGSTVVNAALYVRGNRKDYDDWEEMGAKGWSYKDVLPYFKKSEDNQDIEYLSNGYHGANGPVTVMRPHYKSEIREPLFQSAKSMGYRVVDPNARSQTGFYDFQATLRHNQRCSNAKAYLVPAENRTNLDILPNALVTKVIIEDHRATGVLFDVGGRSFAIKANREVIVSAGTVKTAQLLLLSGIGPKEELRKFNIPVHADLPVGRNLHDHGANTVDFVLSPYIRKYSDKLTDPNSIRSYIYNRTGPLTTPYGIFAMAFLYNDEINPRKDFPNYELYFLEGIAEGRDIFWNLKPEVFQQVYGPYVNSSFLSCFSQILHPRSRGSVTLQSSNPHDPPVIDPNYLQDPRDEDDIVEGMKTCKRIVSSYHMKRVGARLFQTLYPGCERYAGDDDTYFRCQIRSVLISIYHPVGTAKMGDPKDPTTVVDTELRVKYIKDLRVVDNSIMPKITSGNTAAPATMIGEKASDLIKKSIRCNNPKYSPFSKNDGDDDYEDYDDYDDENDKLPAFPGNENERCEEEKDFRWLLNNVSERFVVSKEQKHPLFRDSAISRDSPFFRDSTVSRDSPFFKNAAFFRDSPFFKDSPFFRDSVVDHPTLSQAAHSIRKSRTFVFHESVPVKSRWYNDFNTPFRNRRAAQDGGIPKCKRKYR